VTVVCFFIILGLYLFLRFTKIGWAFYATSEDSEAAALQGIRVERIYAFSFLIGAAIAGTAGGLVGALFSINPWMGVSPLLKGLAAIILGGLGSLPGAIIGGTVLGMAESFGGTFIGAAFQDMISFIVIIIVLILRPSGLFGERK
jgi:branched-chain amino acid transport system permease protein